MRADDILDEPLIERTKPVNFLLLALIPVFMGPVLGIATNYLNARISKEYFQTVMEWDGLSQSYITYLAMVQGAREGFLYGAIFSLIFTSYVAWRKYDGLGNKFFRFLLIRVPIIITTCWLTGGILGVVVFYVLPDTTGVPFLFQSLNHGLEHFGWVGGSIRGGMLGGVVALAWAIYRTSREEQRSIAS